MYEGHILVDLAEVCDELEQRRREPLILGGDTPWPLDDVLERLADAAEHLLDAHSCDAHGYEKVQHAAKAAREYVAGLRDHRG